MNKEDCLAMLLNNGYRATLESGVIILSLDNEKSLKRAFKEVRNMGYKASLGARIVNGKNVKFERTN